MKNNPYSGLAASYEDRFKQEKFEGIISAINGFIKEKNYSNALEIGCGTGYWLRNISLPFIFKTGIDLSPEMLSVAKAKDPSSYFICADALYPPVKNDSFDFIFLVNTLHQITRWRTVLSNAKKAIKPNGTIGVVGIFPRDKDFRWYVYDYFPEVKKTDFERYQRKEEIFAALSKNGCRDITAKTIYTVKKTFTGKEVYDDPFLRRHNSSQLARLDEKSYQTGLSKIASDISKYEKAGQQLLFKTNIAFHFITAVA